MTAPIRITPPTNRNGLRIHNNMFGFKGVSWDQSRSRFRARIGNSANGEARWLGSFSTPEDAARAYDEASRERYGADAFLNFPGPDEKGVLPKQTPKDGTCINGHPLKEFWYVRPGTDHIRCRKCKLSSDRKQRALK